MIEQISHLAIPLVMVAVGLLMLMGRRDYFLFFCQGAREGLRTAVQLLPTLTALTVAISMLNASGAVEAVTRLFTPAANAIGLPAELLPLLLTRPFSGGASTAALSDLFARVGTDSAAGLCASVIFGSSDTLVYVISVYCSSVGIRRTRWAFPVAIGVMLFCIFFSCFLCRMWFF